MPPTASFLAAGIVDHALAARLSRAFHLVPPSWLFYAAVGLLFLGLLLKARLVSTYLWGGCFAFSALATVLWGAAILSSLFLHRTYEERHADVPASPAVQAAAASALDGPCATKADCAKPQVCAKVGADVRCRTVCAKGKACNPGFSCVVPETGPTVCFPDAQLPH